MKRVLLLAAASLCLTGCGTLAARAFGSYDDLTARALNIDPTMVGEISNRKAGAFTNSWDAELTDGRKVSCTAGEMMGNPRCRVV